MNMKKDLLSDVLKIRVDACLDTSSSHLQSVLIAAEHKTIRVFYSNDGDLLGYVAWVLVSKETFSVMKYAPYLPSYPYEFNEGRIIVVFDVVFKKTYSRQAKLMAMEFFRRYRFITYLKKGRLHCLSGIRGRFKKISYTSKPRFTLPKLLERYVLS